MVFLHSMLGTTPLLLQPETVECKGVFTLMSVGSDNSPNNEDSSSFAAYSH